MLRFLLPVLMLGWAGEAFAQTSAVVTLDSHHFDRDKQYNERNFGLGLEQRLSDDWALSAGFYRNSFDRHTNYAMAGYTPLRYAGWRIGAVFGGVTGYSYGMECKPTLSGSECWTKTRISPWLTGIAKRDFGRFGINVVLAPSAVALQVKFSLDGRHR